jgi:hypothetical protein
MMEFTIGKGWNSMIKEILINAKALYHQGWTVETILAETKITKFELYQNLTSKDKNIRNNGDMHKKVLSCSAIEKIKTEYQRNIEVAEICASNGIDKGILWKVISDHDKKIRRNRNQNKCIKVQADFQPEEIEEPQNLIIDIQDGRHPWVSEICQNWLREKRSA